MTTTFFIPGDVITSVTSFGAGAPETGYYSATIKSINVHPTKATSRKMSIDFETGFSTHGWLNSPFDAEGNQLPGLSDKQVRGQVAAIKSVFESAGYTNEQMAQGVTDEWLIGKTIYIEWHSAKDRGAQYGDIVGYIGEKKFTDLKAAGTKPAIATSNNVVTSNGASNSVSAPVPGMNIPPIPQTIVQ
jgi:hypothetical protein